MQVGGRESEQALKKARWLSISLQARCNFSALATIYMNTAIILYHIEDDMGIPINFTYKNRQ